MMTPHAQRMMELKAHAYDCLTQIEAWQRSLQQINAQIQQLAATPAEAAPDVRPFPKEVAPHPSNA